MNQKAQPVVTAVERSKRPNRQASIDVFRGLVMFLMLAEVMELMSLKAAYPGSRWAEWLHFHTTHVPWVGCSLHDLIQPSFSFLVGVSLPFSLASRRARGQSFGWMAWHAAWRSLLLIMLGIALRSLGQSATNFFFVDTLTQIGLGYFWLFLLGNMSRRIQVAKVVGMLLAYWALFAVWPLPPADFDKTSVGVPADWPHWLSGFAAHWNKNAHPAFAFDVWFMNLFPREQPYLYNSGGYVTLNFVPTLATMLLGLLAGGTLHKSAHVSGDRSQLSRTSLNLVWTGVGLLLAGWGLGELGMCPVVKRIWTPAWVLYSGGWCFLILGLLHWVCDVHRWQAWAWPVLVIGANSITAYVMSWTMEAPIRSFLLRHVGEAPFLVAGPAWEPVLLGSTILLVMWLILLWLYRKRIFVRI